MSRFKHRQWRNGRGGKWNRRARWFAEFENDYENIRLNLEDSEEGGSKNHYPADGEAAELMWNDFKAGRIDHLGKEKKSVVETP